MDEGLKKSNLRNIFFGILIISISTTFSSIFLPFYLKDQGLSILQIGLLFTIGMALGSLIVSIFFSNLLRRIKLKTGFFIAIIFTSLQNFLLFIFPNSFGVLTSKISNMFMKSTAAISGDVALQHNIPKGKHRKVSALQLIFDSMGYVLAIILLYFLIDKLGFRITFLIFSFIAIPAFLFYGKVNDEARVRVKSKNYKLPKTTLKLKLILFSELLYWLALASSFSLVITFLVTDLFSQSIFWIGVLFIALYASISITTWLTYNKLEKWDLIKSSIFGMIILLLSAVLIIVGSSMGNIYFVLIAMILEGIGAAIWVPSKSAFYWKLTNKRSREKVSGYLFGLRGFANSLAPLVGGLLATSFGILAPFYFKAVLSLIVILIYIYVLRKN